MHEHWGGAPVSFTLLGSVFVGPARLQESRPDVFGVPQDVLSQLFALLSFVTDPTRRLLAALLIYALVPVPAVYLLRRVSLVHSYKLFSVRFGFRRIWNSLRRRPRQAADAAVRLAEDTGANPVTAVLCWVAAVGLSVWWWLAVLDGFDTPGVRADLGQRRAVMFGVPLTPSVRWSVDSDHAVLLMFALCFVLSPILVGIRFRMVHARMTRQRGRVVPTWYADGRFVLGFSLGLTVLIIGDLMLWSRVALLIAVAAEVTLSAVLVRTTRLEAVAEPLWVSGLAAPAKVPGPARRLGLPWRPADPQNAAPRPVRSRPTPPPAPRPAVSPTAELPASHRRLFARSGTTRADPPPGRTSAPPVSRVDQHAPTTPAPGVAVLADSWAAYAPPLAPLKPSDPRRIGSYALLGRLGCGGMSVVYAARHRGTRREVAIKVMRDVLDDSEAQLRLLREMEALAQSTGPYTVKIATVGHESLENGGVGHFLVMQRLLGPNLWDFVNRGGPITDPGALTHLAVVLAAGLSDFHARAVTHRDLKPANIMLTEAGPVIVDLGIAKLADVTATMPGSQGFATLGYVAPETILGRGTAATADVWSWGCCVAYAASGQRLFPGEQWEPVTHAILHGRRNLAAMEAIRRVSPPLADLVWAATDPDPQRRPFNGSALLARLPGGTRWPTPCRALGRMPLAPTDATAIL
jgi:hypothetical protein